MSCAPVIVVSPSAALVVSGDAGRVTVSGGQPVRVVARDAPVRVSSPVVAPTIIEVCKSGIPAVVDFVWPLKPDATLTYDASDVLTRIDYVDGTFKVLSYDGSGKLTQVQGPNKDGNTVTKTLSYTGDLLTGVATVVS